MNSLTLGGWRARCRGLAAACVLFGIGAVQLWAGDFSVQIIEKQPPKEIAPDISKLLQNKAIQLSEGGKPVYQFWFCSEIPIKSKPAETREALDAIKQPTLMGAVAVLRGGQRDYKDSEVYDGIYTMRFGLQPNDGNHLGTSDYAYFAVLVQAKLDPKPDAITTYRGLTKASSKDTPTDHPVILSLRPVRSTDGEFPRLTEPASDHRAIRLKVRGKTSDSGEEVDLIFDLVFEGMGHV